MENIDLPSNSGLSSSIRKALSAALLGWLVSALPFTALAQDTAADWWSAKVERALSHSGTNRQELLKALKEVPPPQRPGLQFLVENMPETDLQSLSAAFLLNDLSRAYTTRDLVPWGKNIPDEIFFDDVLPYVNINERREDWRKPLFEQFLPLVKDCKTPSEAAQRLNEKIFPMVHVKYSTARRKADQSPSESMASGLASCTGLSILLIDACRSVGVPARLAGVPNWADNRGNHTWVEIWDQRWHFTGAAEPDANGLDHTWFQADAARAVKDSREHAIYAATFKKTDTAFPLVFAPGVDFVSAVNVTDEYTQPAKPAATAKTRLLIKIMDRPAGARVTAQVTVSSSSTDAAAKFEGTSHDEKFDSNDMLVFEVPQNGTFNIEAAFGQQKAVKEFHTGTKDQEVVVLYLSESGGGSGSESKPLKPAQETKLKEALNDFFNAKPEQQASWKFDHSLEALLQNNETAIRQIAWDAYRTAPIHDALKKDYDQHQVHFQNYLSPYTIKTVGQKPPGGWPLFIAMHGGGGAPKELNDSQWRQMQIYYRDQTNLSGGYLYLALRAPNDTWNGFYDDYVYPLIDNLIREYTLFADVDPDKVFIMGYSHGGYGAFAIGPKMPDHFAAIHASASAATDGETSAKTLRSTPFAFMVGEKDTAYGRIDRARAFDKLIHDLRGDRTDIYPVTFEYEPGYAHGGLPDRDKIKDMYSYVRNPVPPEITWEQTDKVIQNFFWLQVPEPGKKKEIDATCRNNHITVTTTDIAAANVLLDSRLIDFKLPVTFEVNGKTSTQKLQPSLLTLCQTLLERGDPSLSFTAKIPLPL